MINGKADSPQTFFQYTHKMYYKSSDATPKQESSVADVAPKLRTE